MVQSILYNGIINKLPYESTLRYKTKIKIENGISNIKYKKYILDKNKKNNIFNIN